MLADLDAAFLGEFLDHLERERGNCARSRNARLAAIHAFFRYVALTEPAHALHCQRVLAIPSKRFERGVVEFLGEEEVAGPARGPRPGHVDRTARPRAAARRGPDGPARLGADRRCGARTSRSAPAPTSAAWARGASCAARRCAVTSSRILEAWLREQPAGTRRAGLPQLPRRTPQRRRRRAARGQARRRRATSAAPPSVASGSRRTCCATPPPWRCCWRGVDRSVIALWLGHESIETTQIYLHADLRLKEQALARTAPRASRPGRYRPDDALLAFLEGL